VYSLQRTWTPSPYPVIQTHVTQSDPQQYVAI